MLTNIATLVDCCVFAVLPFHHVLVNLAVFLENKPPMKMKASVYITIFSPQILVSQMIVYKHPPTNIIT